MAKLARVTPFEDPGLRRVRAGAGFRYIDRRGRSAKKRDAARARALVIPPAWEQVWISERPDGHIQAVGTDQKGRRQYLYHPDWAARRDKGKFARVLLLADALPRARARVTADLRGDGLTRERVLATAFRLLDQAAPRVGSPRYLEANGSRGLTTLRRGDAAIDGSVVTLSFPAKSGKRALLSVDDDDLATAIDELAVGRPRAPLLSYRRGRRRIPVTAGEVNDHVRALTGGLFTAKDFRTLRGTVLAAEALARIGPVDGGRERAEAERLAVQATAEALGNTVAVARRSYIHPGVFARYERGETMELGGSPEAALRRLLS
ncbi:MAG TPA: DNA topoisomerase IB [Microbacterium sp.]|uniref:DNA topoisomerase IB n=1 Tax=Microbacterium sp. TaxID=51671 RepID=UPI002B5B93E9|nr:DNA topoisomerase IB [Microbacterium sp.]HWI32458.1 DNA topoisomerase IB [Microbacterium sp.]